MGGSRFIRTHRPDPSRDLVLERVIDVPPDVVWKAWTTPEHVIEWFAPAPWTKVDCEIDLRPGGIFRTVMRSPGGQDYLGRVGATSHPRLYDPRTGSAIGRTRGVKEIPCPR